MLPTAFAEGEEVNTVTYKFQQYFRTDSQSGWLENGDGSWHSSYKGFPTNPTDPGMMWAYLGHAGKNPVGSTFVNMTTYVGTNRGDADEWTAFKIKVPADGLYTLSSGTAYKYTNATQNLKMYLFPLEGEYANVFKEGNTSTYGTIGTDNKRTGQKLFGTLNVSADSLIGATNIYSATDVSDAAMELSDVKQNFELEADKEYVLLLRAETRGAQTISTLTFSYTEKKPELTSIEATFADVVTGDRVFPESVVWKSNGEEISDAEGVVSVQISSDSDDILSVDGEGNITATRPGSATVRVVGTLNGISKYQDVRITVLGIVTYKFQQYFRTDSRSGWLENGDGSWHSSYKGFPTNPTDPGMMWAYLGHAGKNPVGSTFVNMTTYVGTNRGDADEWTAFKIKVPADGLYTLSSGTAYKYTNATQNLKMYLFPLEGEYANVFKEGNTSTYGTIGTDNKRTGQKLFGTLNVSADSLIGATNIYSATDVSDAAMELSDVKQNFELEADKEYVLLLRAETRGAQTISTLTFSYAPIEEVEEIIPDAPTYIALATANSTDPNTINVIGNTYTRGQSVTVTAEEIPGYTFRHWVRGTADKGDWVSSDPNYTFTLATNTFLTAVYTPNAADNAKIVEFFNGNGEYITEKTVENGSVTLPDDPKMTGFDFWRWIVAKDTPFAGFAITAPLTRVVAEFKDTNDTFTVDGDNALKYDAAVTRNSTSGDEVAWYRDGNLVGYGASYTYRVWAGVDEITQSAITTKAPVVYLDPTAKDTARMIEYDAGDKEIVEVGILFGDGTNMTVDSCKYKATSQKSGNALHGQFTAKPADNSYTIAKGYLIYRDGSAYKVVYSN